MSPPINLPDGTEVSEVILPDGSTASEVIAPDGSTVVSAIPDTSMFQSPIYQWTGAAIGSSDGTAPVDWPESLAGLSDASAVNSPEKQTQSGKEAVLYDPAGPDYHTFTPDAQLPTGAEAFSIAATVYFNSTNAQNATYWGDFTDNQMNSFGIGSGGTLEHAFFNNDITGSTPATGQFITIGVRYDGSNRKLYLNGSGDGSDSPGSVNVQDTNHALAYRLANSERPLDGYAHDIVVCDVAESDQAFADYHNDRI